MGSASRPLAVVTGASSGIGLELARECAQAGYDLVIAADEPSIKHAGRCLEEFGARVEALHVNLAELEGVDTLLTAIGGRAVSALLVHAGRGLGQAFLDQEWSDILRVVDTNVTGPLYLTHHVVRNMRARGEGCVLITGSVAGFIPGSYQAVYNGTKALLDAFCFALRAELADTGVTVTCLMPGATEKEFFERAGLVDSQVGLSKKLSADELAKLGFEAMRRGDAEVNPAWSPQLRTAIAKVVPSARAEPLRKPA